MKKIIIFLFVLIPIVSVAKNKVILIKSIAGSEAVQITRNAKPLQLHMNDELKENDKINTDSKTSIEILYDDGAEQAMGNNSELIIQPYENEAPSSHLENGSSVVKVLKSSANTKNHKFYIRTSTAVMGVRGTVFVVDTKSSSGGQTTLHTIEGTVEMAKSQKELISGAAIPVRQNEMLHIEKNNMGVKAPFNPTNYLSQLQISHPQGLQMIRNEMQNRDPNKKPESGSMKDKKNQPQDNKQQDGDDQKKNSSKKEKSENKMNDHGPGNGPGNGPGMGNGPGQGSGKGPGMGNGPGKTPGAGSGPGAGGNPSGGPGAGMNPSGPPPVGPSPNGSPVQAPSMPH